MMTMDEIKRELETVAGIEKTRRARLKDGVFVTYKPVVGHVFTDFISVDSAEFDLQRTRVEYERFFK